MNKFDVFEETRGLTDCKGLLIIIINHLSASPSPSLSLSLSLENNKSSVNKVPQEKAAYSHTFDTKNFKYQMLPLKITSHLSRFS
jgi:hypothetical protein